MTERTCRICERVVKRPPMAPFNGFGKRAPSTQPPVQIPSEATLVENSETAS